MDISHKDLTENFRYVTLSGRMDIKGTDEIAAKFAELASSEKRQVIVDLTGVTFLASIGIRALISNAKALHKLGGRMALVVGDNASVAKTLQTTGIDVLIPIVGNLQDAVKALQG